MTAPRLTPQDVRAIARLARLDLSDADVDVFTGQLANILSYASAIQQIDTDGVAPFFHPAQPSAADAAWRADEPVPSLTLHDSLANAPDASHAAGLFRVPKVL